MEKIRPFSGVETKYPPRPRSDVDDRADSILGGDANPPTDRLGKRAEKVADKIVSESVRKR